jgi:hypothetical protein
MAALTANRSTVQDGNSDQGPLNVRLSIGVEASVNIYQGALVVVDSSGYACPAGTVLGTVVGRADASANNASGAANAIQVPVRQGVFLWNTTEAPFTAANFGQKVYAVDDNTVSLNQGVAGATAKTTGSLTTPLVSISGVPAGSTATVTIGTGGVVGTALFTLAINGVTAGTANTTTAASVSVTGGYTVTFAAGTYTTNDVYTLLPTVVHTGTGPATGVTIQGAPAGEKVTLTITTSGALATATYALQIGNGAQGPNITTVVVGSQPQTESGLTINMAAGSYVSGDTYVQANAGTRSCAGYFMGLDPTGSGMAMVQTTLGAFGATS